MTRLVFVDDSKDTIHSCFGAVVATGDQVALMESRLTHLRSRIEADLLIPDIPEFHGYEMFQGEGHWAGVPPDVRFEVFVEVLNVALEANVDLILRATRIEQFKDKYHSMNLEATTFENLLERVHEFLQSMKTYGLVTSDKQDAHSTMIRANLVNSRLFGTRGYRSQELKTILDTIHFIDSHQSPAIQIADVATFVWRRHIGRKPSDPRSAKMVATLSMMVDALVPEPRGMYMSIR